VQLGALDSPALDRSMVEELFGLSRRGAIRLMAQIQRPRPGTANVLDREKLVAWLDRLERTRPVADAVRRQRQIQVELAQAAREAEARSTPVTPAPPSDGWPEGITLPEPGVVALRFRSAEHLLGLVLALAEQAAGDYGGFQARLEGNRST
jgi:hypothetical protein